MANLRDLRLLSHPERNAAESKGDDEELDCHPLLREHFGAQLKLANTAAWREGNNRLYEYYKSTAKELPNTIQEMAPLFAAVIHGCQAGKHQEALDEVYWKRILRGDEKFDVSKLGAFGADIAALSGFFDPPWRKPVDGLTEADKSFVLAYAGYDLRALSRLAEAAQPMQAGLDIALTQKNWNNAARAASTISETYLTIGDMTKALAYAKQSVELADRSDDAFQRITKRTTLADALHQVGRLAEAQVVFSESEEIQKKHQPEFPFLYAWAGYHDCDLLLSQGNYTGVQRRASRTLKWAKQQPIVAPHYIGLDNLSLGRAHLLQSQRESNHPFTESANYLNRAVEGLREAGQQDDLPRGLLARAEFYRVTGALEKAKRDLDEAFSIATRSGMGLFLADCHLEYARLAIADGGRRTEDGGAWKDKAHEHLDTAKKMIEKMGYHRRDKEVEELEKQLKQ